MDGRRVINALKGLVMVALAVAHGLKISYPDALRIQLNIEEDVVGG